MCCVGVCASASESEDLADDAALLACLLDVAVAELDKEAADFRLEDDDQRYDSHVEDCFHEGVCHPHVQGRNDDADYV